jgi:hypothetical protein
MATLFLGDRQETSTQFIFVSNSNKTLTQTHTCPTRALTLPLFPLERLESWLRRLALSGQTSTKLSSDDSNRLGREAITPTKQERKIAPWKSPWCCPTVTTGGDWHD